LVENFPFFSIFLPIFAAIFCMLWHERYAWHFTLGSTAITLLLSLATLNYIYSNALSVTYLMGHFPAPFGNEIRFGALEAFMASLFSGISLLTMWGGTATVRCDIHPSKLRFYYLMENLLLAGLLAIIYSNDIFTTFVFIEIATIAACSLVSAGENGRSLLASFVYLAMSLLGSGLLLLAISILYSITGHLLFAGLAESIASLVATGSYTLPLAVLSALTIAGLSIKSAIFPFHGWLPEAYSSATTPTSALLAGIVTKTYLVFLLKLICRVFGRAYWASMLLSRIFLACGVMAILYGSLQAMRQRDLKQTLSYASISQIGYISVALGVGTIPALVAACFQMVSHALSKSMLFMATAGLAEASQGETSYKTLRGAARRNPVAAAAFVVGALSLVGIPPLPGFMAKLYLAQSALASPEGWLVVPVILLGTVLGAMYYLPALATLFGSDTAAWSDRESAEGDKSPPALLPASLGVFISLTVLLGFFAPQVWQILEQGIINLH